MIVELTVVGIVVSVLRMQTAFPVWSILLVAILSDRIILFALVLLIAPLLHISNPLFSLTMVSAGIPGIILQIVTVPMTVKLIENKYPHWKPGQSPSG